MKPTQSQRSPVYSPPIFLQEATFLIAPLQAQLSLQLYPQLPPQLPPQQLVEVA